MICEIKQVEADFSALFEISKDNDVVGAIEFPFNFLFGTASNIHYKDEVFHLQYLSKLSRFRRENKMQHKQFMPYIIKRNDERIGTLYRTSSEGFFLTRYNYDCLEVQDGTYSMFEVGLGNDGIAYPIYFNDKLVAEIDKGCVVHNNLDTYVVYATDEESLKMAIVLCAYLDGAEFAHSGEMVKKSIEKLYYKTTNKSLLAKYDPGFKSKCQSECAGV